jgi:hypothetical protein
MVGKRRSESRAKEVVVSNWIFNKIKPRFRKMKSQKLKSRGCVT